MTVSTKDYYEFLDRVIISYKWSDQSTPSYAMLALKVILKFAIIIYLIIELHMLQNQGILFRYMKLNHQIFLI